MHIRVAIAKGRSVPGRGSGASGCIDCVYIAQPFGTGHRQLCSRPVLFVLNGLSVTRVVKLYLSADYCAVRNRIVHEARLLTVTDLVDLLCLSLELLYKASVGEQR